MPTTYPTLQSVALEQGRTRFLTPPKPWINPQNDKFTHSFDKALPGKHTLALYKGKTHIEAATLCQLRSGTCKLNKYLARIGAIEVDTCSCRRESESVNHFCLDAPYGQTSAATSAGWLLNITGGGTCLLRSEVGLGKRKMAIALSGGLLLRW